MGSAIGDLLGKGASPLSGLGLAGNPLSGMGILSKLFGGGGGGGHTNPVAGKEPAYDNPGDKMFGIKSGGSNEHLGFLDKFKGNLGEMLFKNAMNGFLGGGGGY